MHLYPKSIDSAQNVLDIHKSRNANELITVVGRINSGIRLTDNRFRQLEQSSKSSLVDIYATLSSVLQAQAELQAAFTVATTLQDTKRERCINAISQLNASCLELKRTIMRRIDAQAQRNVSQELDAFVNFVHDHMRKMCDKIYTMHLYGNNTSYVVLICRNVALPSGFTSPEVSIKLAQDVTGFKVCFPDGAFLDSEYSRFSNQRDLKVLLASALSYSISAVKVKLDAPMKFDCVRSVDVDESLNVNLDTATQPSEINALLKVVVPLVRKAVGADSYDVLHRLVNSEDGRKIQFYLGQRTVVDTQALNRLYKALKMKRAAIATASTLFAAE